MKKLTIITATKKSSEKITHLINSLNKLEPILFFWVIVNYKIDNDLKKVIKINYAYKNYEIFNINEEGIYQAINYGLSKVIDEYYLVIGDNDEINKIYFQYIVYVINNECFDCIISPVIFKNSVQMYRKKYSFIRGCGICHTLGMVIKKSVHNKIGIYNTNYSIFADQLIMYKLLQNGNNFYTHIVAGNFNAIGKSSIVQLKHLIEYRDIQIEIYGFKTFYYILFFLRLLLYKFRSLKF
jgi:hypothetical protein